MMCEQVYQMRLRCITYEKFGVLARDANHAAKLAITFRIDRYDAVEPMQADDVAIQGRCAACRDFIFADDACLKDTSGALFCAACLQEELDVAEPPISESESCLPR